MESRMIEIRNKVFNRVKNKDIFEFGDIAREEYYYCVGRSIAILNKYSVFKENITKYLNARDVSNLKFLKRNLLKSYMRDFLNTIEEYSMEWNIIAVTYSYEPDSYEEADKDILLYGYLDIYKHIND